MRFPRSSIPRHPRLTCAVSGLSKRVPPAHAAVHLAFYCTAHVKILTPGELPTSRSALRPVWFVEERDLTSSEAGSMEHQPVLREDGFQIKPSKINARGHSDTLCERTGERDIDGESLTPDAAQANMRK